MIQCLVFSLVVMAPTVQQKLYRPNCISRNSLPYPHQPTTLLKKNSDQISLSVRTRLMQAVGLSELFLLL